MESTYFEKNYMDSIKPNKSQKIKQQDENQTKLQHGLLRKPFYKE